MTTTAQEKLKTFRETLKRRIDLVRLGQYENKNIGKMFRQVYLQGTAWEDLELHRIPDFEGCSEHLSLRTQWRAIDSVEAASNYLLNGGTWFASYRLAVDLRKGWRAVIHSDYQRMITRALKLAKEAGTGSGQTILDFIKEMVKNTGFHRKSK